jgi:hypothetical protein
LNLHGLIGHETRRILFKVIAAQNRYYHKKPVDLLSVLFPKFELVGHEWITFDKKVQSNIFFINETNNDNDNNDGNKNENNNNNENENKNNSNDINTNNNEDTNNNDKSSNDNITHCNHFLPWPIKIYKCSRL